MLVWAGQGLSYIIALFALIAGTEFVRDRLLENLLALFAKRDFVLVIQTFLRRYDSVAHPEVIPSLVLRVASHLTQ
jgi:hypothetical protein